MEKRISKSGRLTVESSSASALLPRTHNLQYVITLSGEPEVQEMESSVDVESG